MQLQRSPPPPPPGLATVWYTFFVFSFGQLCLAWKTNKWRVLVLPQCAWRSLWRTWETAATGWIGRRARATFSSGPARTSSTAWTPSPPWGIIHTLCPWIHLLCPLVPLIHRYRHGV
jgi:hypothetical protein